MATEEHKRLADIVKKTHALLRAECHQYGAKIAWERHMARNDVLQVCCSSHIFLFLTIYVYCCCPSRSCFMSFDESVGKILLNGIIQFAFNTVKSIKIIRNDLSYLKQT